MIFGQRLETASTDEALGEHKTNSDGKLFALAIRPAIGVLHQTRERGCLEGTLEILVSGNQKFRRERSHRVYVCICIPSDEFVEHFDVFLYLHHIHGLLGVED